MTAIIFGLNVIDGGNWSLHLGDRFWRYRHALARRHTDPVLAAMCCGYYGA